MDKYVVEKMFLLTLKLVGFNLVVFCPYLFLIHPLLPEPPSLDIFWIVYGVFSLLIAVDYFLRFLWQREPTESEPITVIKPTEAVIAFCPQPIVFFSIFLLFHLFYK